LDIKYKIEIFISKDLVSTMIEELSLVGACKVGEYENVASYFEIEGCWKPLETSKPATGEKNVVNFGTEYKLEIRCEEDKISEAIKIIKEIHPYEEPLFNIIKLENHLYV